MEETVPDRLTLAGFTAVVVFIGLNFVAVRFSNQELAPFWGATLRYVVATLLFFLLVWARRVPMPAGRALSGSIVYGLLNFALFFGLMYWALVEVPAGVASVVLAAVPLFTYLMALSMRLERFRWSALVGAVVVIVGIALIAAHNIRADVPLIRFAAVVGSALAIAAATIVVKRTPRTHPFSMNAVGMGAGAVALAGVTWIAGDPVVLPQQTATQIAVLYLIASSILLFALMVWVIGRWTASGIAYAGVLAPLITIPIAHLLLDEAITMRFLAGGALVAVGVYWGALRRSPPREVADAPATPRMKEHGDAR